MGSLDQSSDFVEMAQPYLSRFTITIRIFPFVLPSREVFITKDFE
jgi:hypothetical protein